MFGELFNESERVRRKAYRSGLKGCQIAKQRALSSTDYYRGGDAGKFLDQFVFYHHQREPVAVGFKIFYEHCREDADAQKAWSYLIADQGIRLIHLIRENLLESLLSLVIAESTNEWARLVGSK